jgi:hypothetical protein
MKFIINQEIGYVHKDRVRILKRMEDYFNHGSETEVQYLCNAVIKTTQDWDMEEEFPIVGDTASIQIRPKGIFQNTKGFYYKGPDKKSVYLTKEEMEDMFKYILRAKQFIEENNQ